MPLRWETFLDAVIRAGFLLVVQANADGAATGVKTGTNSLASSIILVCLNALPIPPTATRRDFITALNGASCHSFISTRNIAPVDLAHAAIGPAWHFHKLCQSPRCRSKSLSVHDALTLINPNSR
jgi:putative DNA methylase